MPKPFVKLTIADFENLCDAFDFSRKITAIHMHHTGRPNRAQYRGLASIESMWNHQTRERGWSDIAQHVTIAPDGHIWTGRNWNHPPASAVGYNGNSTTGPFMFEMVGDFNIGKDSFSDPQKATVIRLIVALLDKFQLPVSALRFHNHMTDEKSCPGGTIDYTAFCEEVENARKSGGPGNAGAEVKTRGGHPLSPSAVQALRILSLPGEIDLNLPEFQQDHLHDHAEESATRSASASTLDFEPRAHLVNLRAGRLSSTGAIATTLADLDDLFEDHLPAALAEAREAARPLRIMFYAHGGLGAEDKTLAAALSIIPWWRDNGIYPIFFIWETGLVETLGQMLEAEVKSLWGRITGIFGRRGAGDFIADHATDPAVEAVARKIGGVAIWGGMKSSARNASEKDSGGAWLLASRLKAFLQKHDKAPIELHAVGHSAGSIFHAHFMEMALAALGKGRTFRTLHHLAPAIRVDLFKQKVQPLLGKGIDSLTCYTMTDDNERNDHCTQAYHKSLLYLIHHALEPEARCPILGLQASIRGDSELRKLFEPGTAGAAEIIWSQVNAGTRHSSSSLTHGGFDNDAATMNSVCRRILDSDSIIPFPAKTRSVPVFTPNSASDEQVAIGILTEVALRRREFPAPAAFEIPAGAVAPVVNVRPGSRQRALCIGIDNYPDPQDRLAGCVSDAHAWREMFASRGFTTDLLLNDQATYDGICGALAKLVANARAGDVIAVHFSGHGTRVDDFDGDESDDDKDEALCCHDFRSGKLVLDDDIGAILDRVPDGVNFSVFLDCCHSGSATRVVGNIEVPVPPGARQRYAKPTKELNEANAAFRNGHRTPKRRTNGDNPYELAREILFAASLPTQFAHEFGSSGVFTATAMSVLGNGASGLSNQGFANAVAQKFPAEFAAAQQPGIYCSTIAGRRAFLTPLG